MLIEIIKCHGSGNRFLMADLVSQASAATEFDLAAFARAACACPDAGPCDGLLYVVRADDTYAMRMFNPDGSEAEMCGNGIRCVARLVRERYVRDDAFTLVSGGRRYPIVRTEPIYGSIPTYGVDMRIATASPDFAFMHGRERFVGEAIPSLDGDLRFTALCPGNPHIVAEADRIDDERLTALGEAVKRLRDDFPRGVNVSLFRSTGHDAIFAATYERGAGLTSSCGTAMTSCSTAAVLLGICREGYPVDVYNRGGMVRCLCRTGDHGITTRLTGNATYEWFGEAEWDGAGTVSVRRTEICEAETLEYDRFAESVSRKRI